METINLEKGKYTFKLQDYKLTCDRNGEEWRSFIGDKAVYCLFNRTIELQNMVCELESQLEQIKRYQGL